MNNKNIQDNKDIIDLAQAVKTLWTKRKTFFIIWPIVFSLSCLWIFPQPRYYECEVKLAPEGGESVGGLASVASSFGINIGEGTSNDAIYPMLYPELFESPEFITSLFEIQVTTDDENLTTDYYTYLLKHQKKNWLTQPFLKAKAYLATFLSTKPKPAPRKKDEKLNPFKMNEIDNGIAEKVKGNITCNVDKKTDVITIDVKDQDRQISALLADSIKNRLQAFIINYRTKKVREDVKFYQHLTDSAKIEYEKAIFAYGSYKDGHRDIALSIYAEIGEKLRNDLDSKLTTYNTFNAQLAAAKAKVQERTPSFTTLKSATVPIKPAGPKRILFVFLMMLLCSIATSVWLLRKQIF